MIIRFLLIALLALLPVTVSGQVKWCTSNLQNTSFAWDQIGRVDYFIVKWDNRPVQNIGRPILPNGSFSIKIPTDLTIGNHIVQVRSCVLTTPNVCSPFVGMTYAYHP